MALACSALSSGRRASRDPYGQFAAKNSLLADGLVALDRRQGLSSPKRRAPKQPAAEKASSQRPFAAEGLLLPRFGQVAGRVPDQAHGEAPPLRKARSAPGTPALAGQDEAEAPQRCRHKAASERGGRVAGFLQAALVRTKQKRHTVDGSVSAPAQSDMPRACAEGGEYGANSLGILAKQSKAQPRLMLGKTASACSTEPPDPKDKVTPILTFSTEDDEEAGDCASPRSAASTICDPWGMASETPRDIQVGCDTGLAWEGLRGRGWKPSPKNASFYLLQPSTEVLIFGTDADLDGVRGTITIVDAAESLYRVRLPDGSQRKILAERCRVIDP